VVSQANAGDWLWSFRARALGVDRVERPLDGSQPDHMPNTITCRRTWRSWSSHSSSCYAHVEGALRDLAWVGSHYRLRA